MDTNQERFDQLLLRLEPQYKSAETQFKQVRRKLVKFFAWRRCEDPESLADETMARIVRNISSGETIRSETPYAYVYAAASNVFREYVRDQLKRDKLVKDMRLEVRSASDDLQDCRKQCLQSLTSEKLSLLKHYYLDQESRSDLAQSQGISINALRLQVHRIKKELATCHQNCIKQQKSHM